MHIEKKYPNSVQYISEKEITKLPTNNKFKKKIFDLYNKFSQDKSYAIKIISWEHSRKYTMERLDILCRLSDVLLNEDQDLSYDIPKHKLIEAVQIYTKIYADCLEFSLNNLEQDQFFLHTDMKFENIVFTKNLDIKLIDVDSFDIMNSFMHNKYIANWNNLVWNVNDWIKND